MQFVNPVPFEEAVEKLGKRSPIGSKMNSTQWSAVPVALRQRAFFSSQVESVRFLQRAKDGVADALTSALEDVTGPDGVVRKALKTGGRAQFIQKIREFAIAEGMGPLDPDDARTIKDIRSERRIGLIFDTQTKQANEYGNWKQGADPDVLNEFPAQRFIRVVDVDTPRDEHQEFEGAVALKTNLQFWLRINEDFGVPWGPWGWGCGHDVEDVDRAEAEAMGIIQPSQTLVSPELDFNEHLSASVKNLDDDAVAFLKRELGDQVKIENGAVWWKGNRESKALAVPPKPKAQAPVPAAPAATPDEAAFPADLTRLETVRQLGGSTGAKLVRDPQSGGLFVLKQGNSPAHVREEFAADQLYRALGVDVPEAKLYPGAKPTKLARFIEGKPLNEVLGTASEEEKTALLEKVQKDFAADALLGNWDVAGLDMDNIIVDAAGTPWRIDNGGALRFRAQGTQKNADQWNAFPTELWTLRDAAQNAQTGRLFGGLDIYKIGRQIAAIDEAKMLAAAPADLREILKARLANMKDVGELASRFEVDAFLPAHPDGMAKALMGIRKTGISGDLPKQLSQEPQDYQPRDETGRLFDRIRGREGLVAKLSEYMRQEGTDYKIVGEWMSAQGGSSWSGRSLAVKYYWWKQQAKPFSDFFWGNPPVAEATAKAAYEKALAKYGPAFEKAWQVQHAFTFELLGRTKMRYNDIAARTIRLVRTEPNQAVAGLPIGGKTQIRRGLHESSSVFKGTEVSGKNYTVQTVPHHRVTVTYFQEREIGSNRTGFFGENENEFVFLPAGIETQIYKPGSKPRFDGGL